MIDAKPALSLEQFLLEKADWTHADINLLMNEDVAKKALVDLRQSNTLAITLANADALKVHGLRSLEEVFTEDSPREFDFTPMTRTRFLNAMESYATKASGGDSPVRRPIKTILELHALGRKELLRLPNFSTSSLRYVEEVLASIGIRLIDY